MYHKYWAICKLYCSVHGMNGYSYRKWSENIIFSNDYNYFTNIQNGGQSFVYYNIDRVLWKIILY